MSWIETNFEDLYDIPSKNGLTRPAKVRGSGYKMINMGELFANDRIGSIEMELVPMNDRELSQMLVKQGDLLFARQSLVLSGAGKCSIVKETNEPTTFESHIIRVRLKEEIADPEFYYYYFKSPSCRIRSIVTQGVQAGIRGNQLKQLKVHLPPIKTQHRIAKILREYDDLIENNKRRIALLEESARQLYKEWFVRFRFPGHEHVKVVDGVPEGWLKSAYGEVSNAVGGGTPSTKVPEYWDDGDITWFVPKDLTQNNSLILLDSEKKITKLGLQKSSAKMLPPNTIMMSSRASIGYFGLYDGEACTNQGFISIIPKQHNIQMYLLHNLMFRKSEIIGLAGGTTYKEINKATFKSIDVLLPPDTLLTEFQEYVTDLINQARLLMKQNKNLIHARDLLLPKLMNGEIAV
ncbi:type I restriction enzyme, S subunit [Nitrosomonas marina]|uniref:Type I restriction enzyme, S subunit n=1 Tax=Nitrosomonas marina TaxID=917 RepID=A0A1I0FNI5_9PROT|nr:restriction endonuclease subunit S [Nitrosomonas marina]SET59071.1 type I restriction enzyme, S subunit [Nitrosomonas marina]